MHEQMRMKWMKSSLDNCIYSMLISCCTSVVW